MGTDSTAGRTFCGWWRQPLSKTHTCHICKLTFPVVSVAMLHCRGDKTYEEDGEHLYLLLEGDFVKVPI